MIQPPSLAENSLFRCLAPQTLLAAAVAAAFAFSFVRHTPGAVLCLAVAVGLAAAARPPVRPLLKRLAAVNIFLGLVWLTLPFTLPPAGQTPAFAWSREATALALPLTLKCNAIFLSFQALAGGLDSFAVGRALAGLGLPGKLVFLFFFTSRYIHVIGEEWRRLRTAAALRAFVPGTNLHTYRTVGNMLGLTVINAIDRSRRVYEAMLLRGFDGVFRNGTPVRPGAADLCFAVAELLFLGAVLFFDVSASRP